MKIHPRAKLAFLLLLLAATTIYCLAQGRRYRRDRFGYDDRYGVPVWTNEPGFEKDVFTFARVMYSDRGWGRGGGGWDTDYRDADLNLSFRLQQVTSLKVDPEGTVVQLTDANLFDYPFIYIVEPGRLEFSREEIEALRKYLLNGGFLMVDDFWGEREGNNLYDEMRRVFPNRDQVELPLDHPIFNGVITLPIRPQIPGVGAFLGSGLSYERWDATEVHYKGIFDDKNRMMVVICHNTDLGDGWEEERTNPEYFRMYSEKYAYPLAINILFYAMTH